MRTGTETRAGANGAVEVLPFPYAGRFYRARCLGCPWSTMAYSREQADEAVLLHEACWLEAEQS